MIERFPKTPEKVKAARGKEFMKRVREELLNVLDPVLRTLFDTKGIHEEFQKLTEASTDGKKLSAEAGDFFRSLIPDGLRKQAIAGESVPHTGDLNEITTREYTEAGKLLTDEVRKLSRKEYKKHKEEILRGSLYGRKRSALKGEVQETRVSDALVDQTVTHAHTQGNQNLIYERVLNTLDRSRNTNYARSSLVVQDIETGIALDLNALLPADYIYLPRAMNTTPLEPDAESMRSKQEGVADLKNYEMGSLGFADFAVKPSYRRVYYGDLRQSGGVLALLHEVAHAWQAQYYRTLFWGKTGFETIYDAFMSLFAKLYLPKDHAQYEDPEKIWEQLEKAGVECLDKGGAEIPTAQEGVINIPNPHYHLVQHIETLDLADTRISESDRKKLQSVLAEAKLRTRFYPIKSDILQEAMDTYVAQERDAWAHAMRTVRFLRRKGLDVEPELKKREDFKGVIDPCLTTYHNNLEMTILNQKTGYRFSKVRTLPSK